jgi:hypothetical protein
MLRLKRLMPLAAALVGAVVLGAPTRARAEFALFLQEAGVNGGQITQVASGADFAGAMFNGTYGDFKVSFLGGAADNGATLSDLLSSTTAVTNTSGTTKTLNLWVSQNNYTLPAGSLLAGESGLGGSGTNGTLGLTGIFQAYADANNNLLAKDTLTGGAAVTDFTNGPQNATPTGTTFDTGSAIGLFTRTGPYSLTSVASITLSAGGTINYADHVNVTSVPAPAGVVLALTALPCLGFGGWLRRRAVRA